MALVVLLMLVVTQMMNSTLSVTRTSGRRIDADAEVRTIFDRMAGDFSRMVKRADVDYCVQKATGNDSMYFYSEAPSFVASTAADQNPVSLVGYRINANMQLERLGTGLTWGEVVFLTYAGYPLTSSSTPVSTSTIPVAFSTDISGANNASIIGENVFRLEFTFVLKPLKQPDGTYLPSLYSNDPWDARSGHTSLNGIGMSDVQAIVVTVAILDPTSRKMLPPGADFSGMAAFLPDNTDPTRLPAQTWQESINNGAFRPSGIPAASANQVRIYQRVFPLNTQ